MRYGLIGYPLGHSFSPGYFEAKFAKEGIKASYSLFPMPDVNGFKEWLAAENAVQPIRGLNVTLPHKTAIMPHLHAIDSHAQTTGAVNCIKISGGIAKGYNTDVPAFAQTLLSMGKEKVMQQKALVLGSGGAAKAVMSALKTIGIPYLQVARSLEKGDITYENLTADILQSHRLLVNATSAGMYPNIDTIPNLPYEALGAEHILYDLVYNPQTTLFLQKGVDAGATVKNGLDMLYLQAELSWQIWQGND